jgi:hypothetical protein
MRRRGSIGRCSTARSACAIRSDISGLNR